MNNTTIIKGALANTGGEVSSDDLLHFLKENMKNVKFYKRSPRPGVIMGAALDWLAILEGAASIAAVKLFAKILWATYKKFIKPLKDKGRDNSFLYVVIENEKKEFVQFALGKDYQDEEIFVRDFTEKVERIRVVSDSAEIEIEKREIKISEIWKEI